MADNLDHEQTEVLNEAESFLSIPTDVRQLLPHERLLCQAIGTVAGDFMLSDDELLLALHRVRGYLLHNLEKARKKQERGV